MKARRLNMLLCSLFAAFLASCNPIPADIATFMAGFSYSGAVTYLEKATIDYREWNYVIGADGTQTITGTYDKGLDVVFGSEPRSLLEENYEGDLAAKDATLDFVVTSRKTAIAKADQDSGYTKTVVVQGHDDTGSPKTSTQVLSLESGDAKSEIQSYIGNATTQQGGFYYGEWLKSQSRLLYSFMSVDSQAQTLEYNPGPTTDDPDYQGYYDLDLVVDSHGLLIRRSLLAFDQPNDKYGAAETTGSYNS